MVKISWNVHPTTVKMRTIYIYTMSVPRSWPGIEGDGVKFPWTYAPHGVKGDKSVSKSYQCHVPTFLESPSSIFNVEPFMDNDCLCNKLGISTLRSGREEKGKKLLIVTTPLPIVVAKRGRSEAKFFILHFFIKTCKTFSMRNGKAGLVWGGGGGKVTIVRGSRTLKKQ